MNRTISEVLQQSKDFDTFLQWFRQFCIILPRNTDLRHQMKTLILDTKIQSKILAPSSWYNSTLLLPDLPTAWDDKVASGLAGHHITNIEISFVNAKSLKTLCPGKWLNDEIIDGYATLLQAKNDARISEHRMISELQSLRATVSKEINFQFVEHHGHVFVTIPQGSHWTFAKLNTERRPSGELGIHAEHFDSLYDGAINASRLECFKLWCKERFPGVTTRLTEGQSPKQHGFDDCGLFVLMGIRLMSSGSRHLSQEEADHYIPTFRRRVLAELLANKIDPTSEDYELFVTMDIEAGEKLEASKNLTLKPSYQLPSKDHTGPICLDTPPSQPFLGENLIEECSPINLDTPSSQPFVEEELVGEGSPINLDTPSSQPFVEEELVGEGSPINLDTPSSQLFVEEELVGEGSPAKVDIERTQSIARMEEESMFDVNLMISDMDIQTHLDDQKSSSILAEKLETECVPVLQLSTMMFQATSPTTPPLSIRGRNALKSKPSPIKTTDKRCDIQSTIAGFGKPRFLVEILQISIRSNRATKQSSKEDPSLASLWTDVGTDDTPQYAFSVRHSREMFSRKFFSEVEELGGEKDRVSYRLRKQLCERLGCPYNDIKLYRQAQLTASRSSIWTEIVDCISKSLRVSQKSAGVAICACDATTSFMEKMSRKDRLDFLNGIRARLLEASDSLRDTLRSAIPLYEATINNSLPDYILSIEKEDPTKFRDLVSLLRLS